MARLIYCADKDGNKHPFLLNSVDEFDYSQIVKCGTIYDPRRKKTYLNCVSAFDIETTTYDKDYAFMYIWQFCFLVNGYYHVIIGRTWDEFVRHLNNIADVSRETFKVIWVHNLGFEYQNMYNFLPAHEVFAVKSRMPVKVTLENNIEFRCSWKLTNMSLEAATIKEKGLTYIKRPDKIDYRKLRFPDTYISDDDMEYNILDVVSLCDLITNININNHDTLVSMPMTSTGYVRRQCRNRIRKEMPDYRDKVFNKKTLSEDAYLMLKQAARGGNTHANRYYVSELIL